MSHLPKSQNIWFISTIFLPRRSFSRNDLCVTPSHSQVSSNTFFYLIVITPLSIWRKQNTVVEKFLDTSCVYYGLLQSLVSNCILFQCSPQHLCSCCTCTAQSKEVDVFDNEASAATSRVFLVRLHQIISDAVKPLGNKKDL